MNRQTYHAKNDEVKQQWHVVDASDLVLGRLSSKLATVLMGKHKPQYTPHHDVGDFVIVTNAEKIRITGDKANSKHFQRYTGYTSGLKLRSYAWMLDHQPELLLQWSVRRMLPKTKLGRHMLKKLKVYRGPEHPHQSQSPQPLAL